MRRLVPMFILLGLAATVQAANTLYVDDTLRISLRSAPGSGSEVVTILESGTRLELLEESGSLLHVRDPKGNEGWIRNQYVTDKPIARDRLAYAEKKIAALETEKLKLREQVRTIETERGDVKKARSQLEKDYQKVEKELAELRESAANPLKLSNENKIMRDRLATLEEEAQRLRVENQQFHDDSNRQWFLAGAGVLTGGMLLGLLLPKLRRRKSAWSSDF